MLEAGVHSLNRRKTVSKEATKWVITYTGKEVNLDCLRPEDFDIEDVAHALSLTCRFGGHSKEFYSVAQHSCYCADLAPNHGKLKALLHDAHEAYVTDVPWPFKEYITGIEETQDEIDEVMLPKWGVTAGKPIWLKTLDIRVGLAEAKHLMPPDTYKDFIAYKDGYRPADILLENEGCWQPGLAEDIFLKIFEDQYDASV